MIFFRQENNASAKFFPRTKGDKRRTGKIISCHISLGPEFFFFLFFFCYFVRDATPTIQFGSHIFITSFFLQVQCPSAKQMCFGRPPRASVNARSVFSHAPMLPCSHGPLLSNFLCWLANLARSRNASSLMQH